MGEPARIEQMFLGIDKVIDILLPLGILLAVLFVVIGGYMWMTSSGEPDRVKSAQGTLTWAVVGLIFVLIAYLLVKAVVDYVGGL